ncbi:hypothetical protein JS44_16465 [Anoxybacillus flavithermus]|uniref:Uncharacterized protein n=1 Tax=Anoxybacillus flavithermus TaxID=33934 RepID=A0A094J264_9BACL|nr:hypothetical protein JS44_16465 [Anoxybacillus flavithermus]
MEHPKRDSFFLVNLHKTGGKNRVDIGVVQSIEMARDGIVVEPRGGKPWSDQLRQIDVMRPSFQMNECLPTAQDIQGKQPDNVAGSSLALRVHGNETINQPREAKILENGAYYIQIRTFINGTDLNAHDVETPLLSLCFKDSFDMKIKNPPDFVERARNVRF